MCFFANANIKMPTQGQPFVSMINGQCALYVQTNRVYYDYGMP